MSDRREVTMEAVKALMALEDPRLLEFVNPLLGDRDSTDRVRQVIAFLAEITLQIGGEQFVEAMTKDATEGMGWILHSCDRALATLEDIGNAERKKELREVSSN